LQPLFQRPAANETEDRHSTDVRYWHLADMQFSLTSAFRVKQTSHERRQTVADDHLCYAVQDFSANKSSIDFADRNFDLSW
jgi:hypothetical protein